jgi:hypothetical protein
MRRVRFEIEIEKEIEIEVERAGDALAHPLSDLNSLSLGESTVSVALGSLFIALQIVHFTLTNLKIYAIMDTSKGEAYLPP